jgi:hypothetical protein
VHFSVADSWRVRDLPGDFDRYADDDRVFYRDVGA